VTLGERIPIHAWLSVARLVSARRGLVAAMGLAMAFSSVSAPVALAADPLSVTASAETDPVHSSGDAADDTAIWIHPTDPSLSLVIGTDKATAGGLNVYDLSGHELHFYQDGRLNNVDVRYNFPLGSQRVSIVGATNRELRQMDFYRVNVPDRSLVKIGSVPVSSAIKTPRGFSFYHSPISGKYYAFVSDVGHTDQYELSGATGSVTGTLVRQFSLPNPTEGLVADDELGRIYVAEEDDGGIFRYDAEPDGGTSGTWILKTLENGGPIMQDVKGLTLYYGRNGAGYLLAISQGGNSFHVLDRQTNAWLGEFAIVAGNGIDRVTGMDGIDVTNVNLGPRFPQGLFVSQDTTNDGANQNHKLVRWNAIASAFSPPLLVDTLFDPRTIGAPPEPGMTPPETIITSGPSGTVSDTTATFAFDASQGGSTFECSVDAESFASCTSPRTYTGLAEGTHTFDVRATNTGGLTDPSPASRTWTINLSAPITTVLPAQADASVEAATPDANLGLAALLGADTSPQEESYLRFNVQGLGGTVQSAALRLYASNGSTNGPAAYGTATGWSETAITWNTGRPARTTGVLDDKAAITSGTWVEWNVSSLVTGNGLYGVNLAPTSSDGTDMHAREASTNRPELVIVTLPDGGGGDTTAPDTMIDSGPSGTVNTTSAIFTFSSSEAGSTFECKLDGDPFGACTSPATYSGLAEGQHRLDVRATDSSQNTDPSPAFRSWTIDVSPPTVTTVQPADQAVGVPVGENVRATFSEAMNASTLSTSTFTLKRTVDAVQVPAAVTFAAVNRTATLDPSAGLEPSTSYTATLTTGVRDQAGNALASDYTWAFTTAGEVPPPPPSGIVRESTSSIANTTATRLLSIPKPAGSGVGDVLVACLALDGTGVASSGVPAGWTLIAAVPGVTNPKVFGYYHVVGASEPATYTWSLSGTVKNGGGIARYSGVDVAQPLDAGPTTSSAASGTSAVLPAVTTSAPNAMIVGCVGINSSAAGTRITSPGGMNEAWDVGGKRHELADGVVPSAGSTGTRTWTISASRAWAGWLVALRD
jgi:myo-inositol-hexaphosphate 3-phosphohydrolase